MREAPLPWLILLSFPPPCVRLLVTGQTTIAQPLSFSSGDGVGSIDLLPSFSSSNPLIPPFWQSFLPWILCEEGLSSTLPSSSKPWLLLGGHPERVENMRRHGPPSLFPSSLPSLLPRRTKQEGNEKF